MEFFFPINQTISVLVRDGHVKFVLTNAWSSPESIVLLILSCFSVKHWSKDRIICPWIRYKEILTYKPVQIFRLTYILNYFREIILEYNTSVREE